MRGSMMDFPLTVNHIFERAGQLFGDREIASRRPDRSICRYTYEDLYRRGKQFASALERAGLRSGDRVATLMWNHGGHLEAYFGVPFAGGVVHPLNLRLHPDEIAFIANHARDRFLLVDDVLLPIFEKFRGKTNFERVIVVSFGGCKVAAEFQGYEEFLASGSEDFTPDRVDENDAAEMCFTSGTTGQSKGVVYSHRALVLHSFAVALPDALNLSNHSVVFPVSPMFHANGWGLPWASVMVGARIVFPGPHLDPETLLDTMADEGVTHSCGVPTVWLGVQAALEKEPERWRFPRPVRILCGGMAPPVSLIRNLDRFNLKLIHGWGMTETAPLATVGCLKPQMKGWPEEQQLQRRAMQGLAVPFVEVRIMRPEGEAPHDGETPGEIEIRGPWIAASYFGCSDQRHRWTEDGWFRTGDVATMDREGYLKIVDRSKDLIKSGGEWISSVDLENALVGHPAVREAAVIGVAHPKWQERPLAVVVLKEGVAAEPEELREFLAEKFAKWQLPDAFVFVNELPHTSVGKLLKMKLRERYANWDWKAEDRGR
ncbi:MAG TPA: long-chain fatty acid--CoA ligase [Candidatus Acidoferrales bacterium]|nr:long-chain fatty acid--CoA ligase [Candidatus Acidoferrales bacterium]